MTISNNLFALSGKKRVGRIRISVLIGIICMKINI